jgi:hypothetical protein
MNLLPVEAWDMRRHPGLAVVVMQFGDEAQQYSHESTGESSSHQGIRALL